MKGELLRILRASSSLPTFDSCSKFLLDKFRLRGYPPRVLTFASSQVTFRDRNTILQSRESDSEGRRPPFISVHSDLIPKQALSEALEPPHSILQPLLCFKRDKNVADKVVRARLRMSSKPTKSSAPIILPMAPSFEQYNTPCGTPACGCCTMMSRKAGVFHNSTFYKAPRNTHCNCRGLIYLLQCTLCGQKGRYVGQTSRTLRERMAGHRRDHLNQKNMPLFKHLRKPSHSFGCIKVSVLELVSPPTQAS